MPGQASPKGVNPRDPFRTPQVFPLQLHSEAVPTEYAPGPSAG